MPSIEKLRQDSAIMRNAQPQKAYMWTIALPDLTVNTKSGAAHYTAPYSPNHDLISMRVNSASIPFHQYETEKHISGNSFVYSVRSVDIGNIVLEVYEFEDGYTMDYFRNWESLILTNDGTFKPPVAYKRDIYFYWWDAAKNVLARFRFKDYFISGIADLVNEYESNTVAKYAITLTGDDVDYLIISDVGEIESTIATLSSFKHNTQNPFNGVEGLVRNIIER
jgi:hypothetical protein